MSKQIYKWHIIGIVFIILVGSFFHFIFELSGENLIIAGIAAVNESVWEHLKLGYWPLVFFSLIEYRFIKDDAKNLGIAKLMGALTIIATILVIFYSYTAIIGEEILFIDILSFILGVIFGQIVSYKLMSSSKLPQWTNILSWILFVGLGFLFILFTFYPPKLPIFKDGVTGGYGIV
ncbi:MAG: DUF6512 family protein [Promethearchaeota archaeon]